jgi:hypothetical protein
MPDIPLRTRESATALDVWLHVQPRAGRNEIAGIHNGALKLKVTAPPVDDAAKRGHSPNPSFPVGDSQIPSQNPLRRKIAAEDRAHRKHVPSEIPLLFFTGSTLK